jgi:hypothetical protein
MDGRTRVRGSASNRVRRDEHARPTCAHGHDVSRHRSAGELRVQERPGRCVANCRRWTRSRPRSGGPARARRPRPATTCHDLPRPHPVLLRRSRERCRWSRTHRRRGRKSSTDETAVGVFGGSASAGPKSRLHRRSHMPRVEGWPALRRQWLRCRQARCRRGGKNPMATWRNRVADVEQMRMGHPVCVVNGRRVRSRGGTALVASGLVAAQRSSRPDVMDQPPPSSSNPAVRTASRYSGTSVA